jgi:hypothetical protein
MTRPCTVPPLERVPITWSHLTIYAVFGDLRQVSAQVGIRVGVTRLLEKSPLSRRRHQTEGKSGFVIIRK